jgi:hypothetical protein
MAAGEQQRDYGRNREPDSDYPLKLPSWAVQPPETAGMMWTVESGRSGASSAAGMAST